MNVLVEKFKEVALAVLPITVIVLFLHFTITPIETPLLIRFIIGAVFIIIGLSIFLFGVDLGITPIGTHMGGALAKTNKLWIVGLAGLFLGFFISIAEPDLHILAGQVADVTGGAVSKFSIVVIVSIGIALLLAIGLLRIVYNIPLHKLLTVAYLIILGLGFFTSPEFLAVSFDSSGATTGALTVPFMLALALGVSSLKRGGKESEEDSFGLVGVASAGAIIAVMIMSIITKSDKIHGEADANYLDVSTSIIGPYLEKLPTIALEITVALLPIIIIFFLFNRMSFKLSHRAIIRIIKGLVYTFVGLVLFLTGVNAGFMEVGRMVGYNVAAYSEWIAILIGFILGLVVILAEPAVYVLTNQIETVTSGYIKRKVVLVALSIGVAFAVSLSIIRIVVPGLQLWHFLLPGYVISIIMAYYVPGLFVGMAFDAGGVASGPMTATFILAFAQGAAYAIEGANVLVDGFGVIAMVAMTPIIALQTLGFIFKMKAVKRGINADE